MSGGPEEDDAWDGLDQDIDWSAEEQGEAVHAAGSEEPPATLSTERSLREDDAAWIDGDDLQYPKPNQDGLYVRTLSR